VNNISIYPITKENFHQDSLKSFNRYQSVKDIYILADGQLVLKHNPFEENWSPTRRKEKAQEILSEKYIVYGAFDRNKVVGEIMLIPKLNLGRMIVDSLHVDCGYRRQGIGRLLFSAAKTEAIKAGATGLYLSACSAKETIDFYRAMGCFVSPNPIPSCVEKEPCDIQMECTL